MAAIQRPQGEDDAMRCEKGQERSCSFRKMRHREGRKWQPTEVPEEVEAGVSEDHRLTGPDEDVNSAALRLKTAEKTP
ncbi:hypothetical protein ColTof4_04969 [Colletotrichum tofieldiae]|nr:hypothetical protein ColTof3_10785 [Colletotrichum tofieldiae]GKT72546.1 hypothetical protein ColTof4_04969 [Colletotrichum tofieldiae]GKT89623.1 hypothetical protein Ct61P_07473 [Colletotrichum tofieldiae]